MGLFDNFQMPDLSDPQTAARIRGALIGLGQSAAQPYSNLGSIAAGVGAGQQQGLQQYQQNQSNQMGLASDKLGMQQKLGSVNFLRNLQGQQPLTLDDVMKGNFGAPMGTPAMSPQPSQGGAQPSLAPQTANAPMGAPMPQPIANAPLGQQASPTPIANASLSPQAGPTPIPNAGPATSSLIPADLQNNPLFQAAIQSGDSATVMSMLTKHQTQLTPDQLAAANLPPDTLAFKAPDGTVDIKRVGTIQSPAEIAAATAAEQAKGLKSQAELDQDAQQEARKARITASIQPPSVERSILLPLMQKMERGETLTPQEQSVLQLAKPQALMGPQGLQPTDANSGSLQGQTGLSQAAINYITTGQAPRGTAAYMAITKEIDDFARSKGINTVTLKAQAKGYNDVLTNNIQRNNQAQILENEIQGSIGNVAPLADAIGQGKISAANLANVWAGKQVNDPTVAKFKDQLFRLQHELASYNVVAGGQLNENGSVRGIEQGDLDNAADIISKGINSGGLQGLASSIASSTAKNKAVLGNAIDDANKGMWSLFGVGQNFKPQNAPAPGATPAKIYPAPPPAAISALKMKKDKSNFDQIFGPGAADKAINGR